MFATAVAACIYVCNAYLNDLFQICKEKKILENKMRVNK